MQPTTEISAAPALSAIPTPLSRQDPWLRTIRPFAACALSGICFLEDALLALDTIQGYVLGIDPSTDSTTVLNPRHVEKFIGAKGLAVAGDTLWFAQDNRLYYCSLEDPVPQHFVTIAYPIDGVAIWQSTIYIASQRLGYILIFSRETGQEITRLLAPGVGEENLTVRGEELWVCDRTEQTVYCLDRATGEEQLRLLTPFPHPTGLAFHPHPTTGQEILYVAYAGEEPYIRDNPNAEDPLEISFRDETMIHPLHFQIGAHGRYALSNGYLIEMSYVEELLPTEAGQIYLENLEWRIALPAETDRQRVLRVEAIGLPFTEERHQDQRVAVFKFKSLQPNERHIFGWKALLQVHGIKYQLSFADVEKAPDLPPEYRAAYLIDNDDLAMDKPNIRQAAREAIGSETNILRKMLKIRNYVYDRLSYGLTPQIDTPDIVLERGVGSCGEYVGLLLALARLNGIACRTVGRYKCPAKPDYHLLPLQPDYNHVWLEFYIPGIGWLPMESNPDDIGERGPYPTRFFMGLPWCHAEVSKGMRFESIAVQNTPPTEIKLGDLAINHVRFTILGEVLPSDFTADGQK